MSALERARLFAALNDANRLQILDVIGAQTRCNCQLQELLDLTPNLLSYHLKVLRDAGLIVGTRRGRWVDYSLSDGAAQRLSDALPAPLRNDGGK